MRTKFVLLVIVGLLLAPGLAVAQSATPTANPVAADAFRLDGFQSWVSRYFDSSQGKLNFSPSGLQFAVLEFDTAADADKGMSKYLRALLASPVYSQDDVSDADHVMTSVMQSSHSFGRCLCSQAVHFADSELGAAEQCHGMDFIPSNRRSCAPFIGHQCCCSA